MKNTILKYKLLIAPLFAILFCSCAVSKGTSSDGSKYMTASFLERTEDEERIITPGTFHERKVGKDQVEGGRVVARSILGAIAVSKISDTVSDVVQARNATKAAEIAGQTDAARIASEESIRLQELANEAAMAELEAGTIAP